MKHNAIRLLAAIFVTMLGLACDPASQGQDRSATTSTSSGKVTAPCVICKGHEIEVTATTPRSVYLRKTYYFCSDHCKSTFDADPAKHVPASTQSATTSTDQSIPPLGIDSLHNAHRVTNKVISGAQPEGEASFKALADLGVKTILSVDGAKPDVELAKKYGLRYVHLPIGYNGVTPEQGRQIAKALDELPGPIYVHCHHGKHRSAAAVAVACVFNGSLPPERAESVLKTFGTGENYKGLWQAARDARPLDKRTLAATKVAYVETATIPALAESMVMLDERWDRIKQIQKDAWAVPQDHPDLDPAHEALQVQELLTELSRSEATRARPEAFRRLLDEAAAQTTALHSALSSKPLDPAKADTAFKAASKSCADCHKQCRD